MNRKEEEMKMVLGNGGRGCECEGRRRGSERGGNGGREGEDGKSEWRGEEIETDGGDVWRFSWTVGVCVLVCLSLSVIECMF